MRVREARVAAVVYARNLMADPARVAKLVFLPRFPQLFPFSLPILPILSRVSAVFSSATNVYPHYYNLPLSQLHSHTPTPSFSISHDCHRPLFAPAALLFSTLLRFSLFPSPPTSRVASPNHFITATYQQHCHQSYRVYA